MLETTFSKISLCLFAGVGTFFCVLNLLTYIHIDEREIVRRLRAVKSNETGQEAPKIGNNFAISRDVFQFRIFSRIFKNIKIADRIKLLLEQADLNLQVDTFVIMSIAIGVPPLIIALLSLPAIAVLSPVMMSLPLIFVNFRIKKRNTLFTQQLPDALDLLGNALRAGHSLFSAFGVIVNEMPDPISKVFKIMTDEIALGIDVKDAMKSLQAAVPNSIDLRFFTTVVILQREIGGNLIKLLEILSATIRERFKMIGHLKSQTMQAKLSGIIVSVIPPIISIILFIMAPDYMDYLINHIYGKIALGVSIVLMIVGYIVIHKITDIDI